MTAKKNRVIFKASPEGLKIFRRISQIFEGNRQVKNDFYFYLPNLNLNRGKPRFKFNVRLVLLHAQ